MDVATSHRLTTKRSKNKTVTTKKPSRARERVAAGIGLSLLEQTLKDLVSCETLRN